MRVKQNNDFGPIGAPENNNCWRPTTAELPLEARLALLLTTGHIAENYIRTPQKEFYDKYGKNVMSVQMLEMSLLGVETVLRLERDAAWSVVK